MYTGFIFSRFSLSDKRRFLYLSFSWIFGLTLGIVLAATNVTQYDPVIYTALIQRPSVILQTLINALPLIAIALLCYNRYFLPTIPIVFLQSFSRGFAAMALFVLVGSGAWVLRTLFLFSGTCVSVITWWLLLYRSDRTKAERLRTICLSVIAVLIVSIVDYLVISPFLADIIHQII